MKRKIEFLWWEPEPSIQLGTECAWTAAMVLHGGSANDQVYEMSVLGRPEGPATWDVTGPQSGDYLVIAKGDAPSFDEACRAAEMSARRILFRLIRGRRRDPRAAFHSRGA